MSKKPIIWKAEMSSSGKKHDLNDFVQFASKQMAEEYRRIQMRAKEDPGTARDQGEENWAAHISHLSQ